jgi:hypothetical protein
LIAIAIFPMIWPYANTSAIRQLMLRASTVTIATEASPAQNVSLAGLVSLVSPVNVGFPELTSLYTKCNEKSKEICQVESFCDIDGFNEPHLLWLLMRQMRQAHYLDDSSSLGYHPRR